MSTKQERSQETQSAIMHAALRLSTKKDIETITIRDICSEAGVSVGAFYHHFSSRQDLFYRAYESFDRDFTAHMLNRKQDKTPLQSLMDLLLFQVSYVAHEGAGAVSMYYRAILNDPSHESVNPNRSYYRATYACTQQLSDNGQLRPGMSPQKTADLCISFVRGCLIDWCLHGQNYDVVDHVRHLLPVLFYGFIQT